MQLKKLIFLSVGLVTILFGIPGTNPAMANTYKMDANAMLSYSRQRANTQTPAPKFQESCKTGTGHCITDVFNKTNTQMMQAIALADEWAQQKHKHKLICNPTYRKENNDDWIQCVDESGTQFYEFQFDDVKESVDDKIRNDIQTAVCQIHNGTIRKINNGTTWYCDNAKCTDINKSMQRFGYSATLIPPQMFAAHTAGCKLQTNSVSSSTYKLRDGSAEGKFTTDPKKFITLQLQSAADTLFFVKRYIERQMTDAGLTVSNIQCNDGFQTYFTGNTFNNQKEDMLTCYATDTDGIKYTLDFLFDDANEMLNYQAKAGTAGLNCLADKGGVFDGKQCSGMTREQCDTLNSELPGGTKWDTTLETCVMKDAARAQNINDYGTAAAKVGIGVTLVAISIASGGATIPAIVGMVGGAVGTAGVAVQQGAQLSKEDKVRQFIARSAQCKTPDCANEYLRQYIESTVAFYDDLDEDSQLLIALDGELARLLELLPTNSQIFQDAISQAIANNQDIRNWETWPPEEQASFIANGMILIGAVVGLGTSAISGWKNLVGNFKGIRSAKSGYTSVQTLTSKFSAIFKKVKESVDTVAEVGGVVDDTMDTVEHGSKIWMALQAAM